MFEGPAYLQDLQNLRKSKHPAESTFSYLYLRTAAAAKSLQSCPTLCNPIDGSPPGFPRPWDSPGKNTGVGCHFLLQCMKVKSESKVAQSCVTLRDPMDCSPPGSSIHGIFQARVLEWGAIAFFSICGQIIAICLLSSFQQVKFCLEYLMDKLYRLSLHFIES